MVARAVASNSGDAILDIKSSVSRDPSYPLESFVDDERKPPKSRLQYFRSARWFRSLALMLSLYCIGICLIIVLFEHLPQPSELGVQNGEKIDHDNRYQRRWGLQDPENQALRLRVPRNMEEVKEAKAVLELYRDARTTNILWLLAVSYIFLQTFMIPGPAIINVLVGSLYPLWIAMLFTAIVSTIGASSNYWLSRTLLRDAVVALVPGRISMFQEELRKQKSHLMQYMLFVRVTPVLPHWFVNVASPIVGVPFGVFLFATAVGHQPMNLITVQLGSALGNVQSLSEMYSARKIIALMGIGVLILLPTSIRWWRTCKNSSGKFSKQKEFSMHCSPMLSIIDRRHELWL